MNREDEILVGVWPQRVTGEYFYRKNGDRLPPASGHEILRRDRAGLDGSGMPSLTETHRRTPVPPSLRLRFRHAKIFGSFREENEEFSCPLGLSGNAPIQSRTAKALIRIWQYPVGDHDN